ncbi:MAG: RDD family protein [Bryobacteraceae bacterium]|nr:RDD family protein [Bryobacteraceae bacterium]
MAQPQPPLYAGLASRLAAFLVDSIIGLLTLLFASAIVRALLNAGANDQSVDLRALWDLHGIEIKVAIFVALVVSLGAVYVPLCHASPAQATVGKWIAKIRVATHDGGRLSFPHAALRWFLQVVSGFFGGPFISIVTMVLDRRRRAVHDFPSRSIVVNRSPEACPPMSWWHAAAGLAIQVAWVVVTFDCAFSLSPPPPKGASWDGKSATFKWWGGEVRLPPGFRYRVLNGADSFEGEFTSADGSVVVGHDIGGYAGAWASRRGALSFNERLTGQARVWTARRQISDDRGGHSIRSAVTFPDSGCANFFVRSYTPERGAQVIDFIATSYRPIVLGNPGVFCQADR